MNHSNNALEIDQNAPVTASGEIEITANREDVWEIMSDIERWTDWNPDITEVEINGAVEPGTEFRWKSGPGMIRSTLRTVSPPETIAWTGKTMGISAVHVWHLEQTEHGTVVRTEESWDGLIAKILKGLSRKMLQKAIDSGLDYLKSAAENSKHR